MTETRGRLWPARLAAVVGGDTFDVVLDLGLGIAERRRMRVAGVNAPEAGTVAGKLARAAAIVWLSDGAPLVVEEIGVDRVGRLLGHVRNAVAQSWGEVLIARGLAVPHGDGGSARTGGVT
ncbi:thermonuclease family protein [Embleya sp. NPDC059237]|uniref:thermonuclease family protein n=1 Tax=Embleya sp. NPDC059237 TaxID=3346784 RepID=UPI0036C7E10A